VSKYAKSEVSAANGSSRISNDNQSNEALDIKWVFNFSSMIVADSYSHHVLILLYDGKLCKAPVKGDIQVLYPLLKAPYIG
jgi:hypothetical protein